MEAPVKNGWTERIQELTARAAAAETYLHIVRKSLPELQSTDEELAGMRALMASFGHMEGMPDLVPMIDAELEYRRFQRGARPEAQQESHKG
jgi:hypothetical protein